MIGQKLADYRITAKLGEGGMGEVWRAEDSKLGREVAIKVLPEALAKDANALARFEREAMAVAALSHPNILSIFDYGQQDGRVFAVMELLEGETLRDRLERGVMPQRKAIEVATAVARGLAAAHEKGIVHRDLKPDNIFLTRDGQIKVLDFGLARVIPDRDGETVSMEQGTRPGTVLGTVGYMSPEQVRGEEADERSDIFSLGVIFYETLAGRRAFHSGSPVETMSAILKDEPPELTLNGEGISPFVERVVRHCLEKKPEQRFQSARDLAFGLESLSGSASASQMPVEMESRPGGRRSWWSLAAIVALGVVLVAYWAGQNRAVSKVAGKTLTQRVNPFDDVSIRFLLGSSSRIVFNARYEPDGESILFSSSDVGSRPSTYRLSPGSNKPSQVGPDGAHLLSVSSQGDMALLLEPQYLRHFLFEGTLARLSPRGGAPRKLLERVRDADWSPDGSELAIIRYLGGIDRLEYPLGTVLLETEGYLNFVRVSPDGQHVAVLQHRWKFDNQGILVVLDLEGGRIESSDANVVTEGVAWSADGETVYYTRCVGQDLGCEIVGMDLHGVERVAYSSPDVFIMDTGLDDRWLTLQTIDRSRMVVSSSDGSRDRDLSWGCWPTMPAISADGQWFAFADTCDVDGLDYRALVRSTDGSPPVELGRGGPRQFSADGKWLLSAVIGPPTELVLQPLGPGSIRSIQVPELSSINDATVATDGESVFVSASRVNEPSRCFAVSLADGTVESLTPEGTSGCVPSPDGRWIATSAGVIYPNDSTLEPYSVPDWPTDLRLLRWSPTGDRLWASRFRSTGGSEIFAVEPRSGERTLLRTIDVEGQEVLATVQIMVGDDPGDYVYNLRERSTNLLEVKGLD